MCELGKASKELMKRNMRARMDKGIDVDSCKNDIRAVHVDGQLPRRKIGPPVPAQP